MSKSIITIRRKRDGKILTDVINDSCQVHNIYDLKNSEFSKDDYINGRYDDKLIISDKDFNIGYEEGVGFYDWADFEVVKDENKVVYAPYVPVTFKQIPLQLRNILSDDANQRLVLNVSRQIGTTTELCRFAINSAVSGKNVLYNVGRAIEKQLVLEKMDEILNEMGIFHHVFKKEGAIEMVHTFKEIRVVCGKNFKSDDLDEGENIEVYIADNADFFDEWVEVLRSLLKENQDLRVVIASCPSAFTSHWSLFKVLCVKEPEKWKVINQKKEYDAHLKTIVTGLYFDRECNNYDSFFSPMRKLYNNIGDLLFMEVHRMFNNEYLWK